MKRYKITLHLAGVSLYLDTLASCDEEATALGRHLAIKLDMVYLYITKEA